MTESGFDVGAYVLGAPTSPRALVRHGELLNAYADGDIGDEREAYVSHFAFGPEMQTHYAANRNSVAGFSGPCWCRWLVLDIDRPNLDEALRDVRQLVKTIGQRYPAMEETVPIYFSGGKGFHVLVELSHNPLPAVGFHRVARTFAEALADRAGVKIDSAIYDVNHILRLPNTKHPRTGLFKRRIEWEGLFMMEMRGILELAKTKDYSGIPTCGVDNLTLKDDWQEAERKAEQQAAARSESRQNATPDLRAPRFFLELLRFGVNEGERHQTLFRAAAWLSEQGAPPSLCSALLTEPGRDIGLSPNDVERQIRCGIEHAGKQKSEGGTA